MARLTTKKAAEYLGCSTATLRKMRQRGTGPRFNARFPNKVFYETEDLDAWFKEGWGPNHKEDQPVLETPTNDGRNNH